MASKIICFTGICKPGFGPTSTYTNITPTIILSAPIPNVVAPSIMSNKQIFFKPGDTPNQIKLSYNQLAGGKLAYRIIHVTIGDTYRDYYPGIDLQPDKNEIPIHGFQMSYISSQCPCAVMLERVEPAPPVPLPAHGLSCHHFTHNDVVFVFPDEIFADCYLWADSAHLSKVSPYWAKLFNSGFQESETELERLRGEDGTFEERLARIIRRTAGEDSGYLDVISSAPAPAYIPDSMLMDEDAEGALLEFIPGRTAEMRKRVHFVVIRDAPMAAYSIVLTWTLTHKLTSKSGAAASVTTITPSLLKKVYDIAHKVEIAALRKLALKEYSKLLNASNAMPQLLSSSCLVYPELRDAAKQATLRYWEAIPKKQEQVMAALTSGDANLELLAETVAGLFPCLMPKK